MLNTGRLSRKKSDNDACREDGSQCASTGRQGDERCQCSMRSDTEAKAHEPSPELDMSRTNSCACAIATSNGGLRGLFCDSNHKIYCITLIILNISVDSSPKMAEFKEAHTDSR